MPACPNCGCPAQPCIDPSPPITRTIAGSGCILIGLDFVDGDTVDFSLTGLNELTAEVIASPDPGNLVEIRVNGVYVPEQNVTLCPDGACNCGAPTCNNRIQLCGSNEISAAEILGARGEISISPVAGVVLDSGTKQFVHGPRQVTITNPSNCLDMIVMGALNASAPDIDVSQNAIVQSQVGIDIGGVGGFNALLEWDPCSNLSPASGAAGPGKCSGTEAYPASSTQFTVAAGASVVVTILRYFNIGDDEPGFGPIGGGESANINTTGTLAFRWVGFNVDGVTVIPDAPGAILPTITPPAAP